MSQQFLDDAQVRATLQEVGRERVPQRVRADLRSESRGRRGALDHRPGLLPREPLPCSTDEQRPAPNRLDVVLDQDPAARTLEPRADRVERDLAHWNEAL